MTRRSVVAGLTGLPFYSFVGSPTVGSQKSSEAPIVVTTEGPVRGVRDGDIAIFRGIPFAAAPVGDLRWKPAAPPVKWKGIRDASQFGPMAPQNRSRLSLVMGDFTYPMAEDNCLTLNIWSPSITSPTAPVMVWIHGGGGTSGSGRLDWYSGLQFARNGGIVAVSLNYRLGPLGLLFLPPVSEGNFAHSDQVVALRWIRANIASFGGDPDNITVAGQSHGGGSALRHMANPESRPLFRRAICQSGATNLRSPEQALEFGNEYLKVLGLNKPEDLRSKPVGELLAGFAELSRRAHRFANPIVPFAEVKDGRVIPEEPVKVLLDGAAGDKELLIGTTRDESAAHLSFDKEANNATDVQIHERFESVYGEKADLYLAEFKRLIPNATPYWLLVHLLTENYLRPSLAVAEARARRGDKTYVYRFDWQSPTKVFGACHTLELPFMFGNALSSWPNCPMLANSDPSEVQALSNVVHRAWINFIKTGNPNHETMPQWASYDLDTRTTMRFDTMVEPVGDLNGVRWRMPWPPHWM